MNNGDLLRPQHDWQQALDAATTEGDERPTWAYNWPAGDRFARDLLTLVEVVGKRVCDLGCGQGQLGFTALRAGAQVCFADGSAHPLGFIRAMLEANQLTADCIHHQWGDPIPGAPYDLILGGDILYRRECFEALVCSIASSLAPGGQALLSDPRSTLEAELPSLASAQNLRYASQRYDGYTLVCLERSR
ncbi:MAG: methyltransferase domain-containing protein [Planctomycetota bacterium]|jgi:2-polyprenyl-3-methyl-5-hydroxy-6-metoxy-1,4-benzoquinol methylase|nr:methyltransferase domain-containing protein [Planctomycetota bacterium]